MLIEDNPTDLKLFVELLHDAGHETVPLANADDALRVLRETGIDLILVDVLLPGTDGLGQPLFLARQDDPMSGLGGHAQVDRGDGVSRRV